MLYNCKYTNIFASKKEDSLCFIIHLVIILKIYIFVLSATNTLNLLPKLGINPHHQSRHHQNQSPNRHHRIALQIWQVRVLRVLLGVQDLFAYPRNH